MSRVYIAGDGMNRTAPQNLLDRESVRARVGQPCAGRVTKIVELKFRISASRHAALNHFLISVRFKEEKLDVWMDAATKSQIPEFENFMLTPQMSRQFPHHSDKLSRLAPPSELSRRRPPSGIRSLAGSRTLGAHFAKMFGPHPFFIPQDNSVADLTDTV